MENISSAASKAQKNLSNILKDDKSQRDAGGDLTDSKSKKSNLATTTTPNTFNGQLANEKAKLTPGRVYFADFGMPIPRSSEPEQTEEIVEQPVNSLQRFFSMAAINALISPSRSNSDASDNSGVEINNK